MLISIVVQAGGESHRMGTNKAVIPFLGQPLVNRVLTRVRQCASELIITTNQPADLDFLDIPLVPDVFPGQGALSGLYTALQAATGDCVAVVACDMPFVNSDLIKYQVEVLFSENCDVVIPKTETGFEPFHAVYRRIPCLNAVKLALDKGEKRMISWFSQVRIRELDGTEILRLDPSGRAFLNINTPEELARAEFLAQMETG